MHVKTARHQLFGGAAHCAVRDPALFRRMLDTGRKRMITTKRPIFWTADRSMCRWALPSPIRHCQALLDQFDARQLLHVTFGSILNEHGVALREMLRAHPDDYRGALQR